GSTRILTVPLVASSTAFTQGISPLSHPASVWSNAGWNTHSVTLSGGPSDWANASVPDSATAPTDKIVVLRMRTGFVTRVSFPLLATNWGFLLRSAHPYLTRPTARHK